MVGPEERVGGGGLGYSGSRRETMEDTPPIEGGGEDGAEPSPAGATDPGMGKAAAARGRVGKKERKMKRERRQRCLTG